MNLDRVKDIFDSIYETGALIIKPADDEIIERARYDLKELGTPEIPEELISFLKNAANGLSWNGFEFFGTYDVTEKKSGYVLKSIVSMNEKFRARKMGMENMLLLGRFDDDIYVYNGTLELYQTLDSLTLTEIDSFDSFEDLFISSIQPYADDDENLPEDDGNADT